MNAVLNDDVETLQRLLSQVIRPSLSGLSPEQKAARLNSKQSRKWSRKLLPRQSRLLLPTWLRCQLPSSPKWMRQPCLPSQRRPI